ncbi:MAG: DUF4835 family protein, partial [Dysgonamonadaceae bacterium]|nr:DUF4835 family protein [Dysgonamonadaceae bacterium]
MHKYSIFFIFCLIFSLELQAQDQAAYEFNATVTVNSDRIPGTNKNIFTTLENSLFQFVNTQAWSRTKFSRIERIDCAFALTITEQISDNRFKAELFVQSRRPVYNSSYVTTMLNWRDTNVEFEYIEGAALEMLQSTISDNLVATVAFYCNLILALDFDSFSLMGGSVFYR